MAELQPPYLPQDFNVFMHTYPTASNSSGSNSCTVQLWVWVPSGSPDSSKAFWKSVNVGYVHPGPTTNDDRHLMLTEQGEPTWVLTSTRQRRYKKPSSTAAPEQSGGSQVDKPVTLEGMSTFCARRTSLKVFESLIT